MGRVGNKLCLALELPAQAFGEVVQRPHQRPEFVLHFNQRQRPQIIRLALLYRRAQTLQRAQRRTHGKPHQQQGPDAQHAQAQQGIGHQAAGHADPGFVGFCDADFCHAIHVRLRHRLEQAHHPHILPLVLGVIEPRQGRVIVGARRPGRRAWQVFVTGNQLLVNIIDLVVNPPGTVIGESVQRHVGHIGTQGAVTLGQPGGDGPRRGQQGAVVGSVCGLATVPVGAQAAGQHQHHQQQCQVPQQAPTQAAVLTHRGLPAGSQGHGR